MMDQIRAQGEAEDELCHQLSGVREKLSEAQAENRQIFDWKLSPLRARRNPTRPWREVRQCSFNLGQPQSGKRRRTR
ncbi:hypothetical protein BOX15_Mlig014829g13 [Macrostomum lignano]|uniref:Uncharacterized protein n=1 Tax=Macrostomum lignano TaxID=282301 RepID=A0A267FKQ1_9PLAT|nr:hypothetical protein BOX15_Mlig014829g13 [Macrostomum lignano]